MPYQRLGMSSMRWSRRWLRMAKCRGPWGLNQVMPLAGQALTSSRISCWWPKGLNMWWGLSPARCHIMMPVWKPLTRFMASGLKIPNTQLVVLLVPSQLVLMMPSLRSSPFRLKRWWWSNRDLRVARSLPRILITSTAQIMTFLAFQERKACKVVRTGWWHSTIPQQLLPWSNTSAVPKVAKCGPRLVLTSLLT